MCFDNSRIFLSSILDYLYFFKPKELFSPSLSSGVFRHIGRADVAAGFCSYQTGGTPNQYKAKINWLNRWKVVWLWLNQTKKLQSRQCFMDKLVHDWSINYTFYILNWYLTRNYMSADTLLLMLDFSFRYSLQLSVKLCSIYRKSQCWVQELSISAILFSF